MKSALFISGCGQVNDHVEVCDMCVVSKMAQDVGMV